MPDELMQACNCCVSDRPSIRSGWGPQGKTEAKLSPCAQEAFSLVGRVVTFKYVHIFLLPAAITKT